MHEEATVKAIIVELTQKDLSILTGISQLDRMYAKIHPMVKVYEALETALKGIVFEAEDGNGRYEIKLDEHHSIVCTMTDGKFDWNQVCDCDHEHEAADKPQ